MVDVSVAQLDRAQASDAWCRWFESNRVHQTKRRIFASFFVWGDERKIDWIRGGSRERE